MAIALSEAQMEKGLAWPRREAAVILSAVPYSSVSHLEFPGQENNTGE